MWYELWHELELAVWHANSHGMSAVATHRQRKQGNSTHPRRAANPSKCSASSTTYTSLIWMPLRRACRNASTCCNMCKWGWCSNEFDDTTC